MYWKVEQYTDEFNDTWLIYNYLEIVKVSTNAKPWYNGRTQEWKYPQEKQLVIKAIVADSEEAFVIWYNSNKKL